MQTPSRVAFTIFGKDIYWYGVLIALGIVIAVVLASIEANRKKLYKDAMIDMSLIVVPMGLVGARLYYVLFELEQYLDNPISMLYIWEGGLAIYGAVIGGLLGVFIFSRWKKIRFLKLADCIAPGLILAQALGRWGNFLNQEAFGLPVTNPALQWFPLSVYIDSPWTNGVHYFNGQLCTEPYHLATFFYESMWCLLVFAVLWFVLRKRSKHDGDIILSYFMLYGFERLFVEGLRGDSLWLIPGAIRVSQLLSLVLFLAILVFFIIRRSKEKKLGALIWPSPEAVAAEGESGKEEDSEEVPKEVPAEEVPQDVPDDVQEQE